MTSNAMQFNRGWNFNQLNRVITFNDLTQDPEVVELLGGGSLDGIEGLPPGSVVSAYATGNVWSARPTSRTDITVQWIGGDLDHPPTNALTGIDLWEYLAGGVVTPPPDPSAFLGAWSALHSAEAVDPGPDTVWRAGGEVTHGDQLTLDHVGPWTVQGRTKGTETLATMIGPGRGFWRFDTPDEFAPTGTYVYNNSTDNHGGIVPAGGLVIDGYLVPEGTRVIQFRNFPDGYDFYARASAKFLFRACRFRFTGGVSGAGLFNDATASLSQQVMMHYCDIGLTSKDPTSGDTIMHLKFLGGANHRLLRNYHTNSATFVQPNVDGVEIVENWIDEYLYGYGEGGSAGTIPNPDAGHLNGISSEGRMNSLKILRSRITAPSPDGAVGLPGQTDLGEIGYGTQPGQVGYGAGTAPGRKVSGTDCIALFTNVGDNHGVSPGSIEVSDNLIGGTGYCLYAGGTSSTNIKVTGNKVTTRWWTNGGSFGAVTAEPVWGVNGNVKSGNVWADDYGTGGDGTTAIANRQYPAGNGPRAGTAFM